MSRFLAGRGGAALVFLLTVGCLDSLWLKYTRPWADLLPLALAVLFVLLLAIRAAARRTPLDDRSLLAGWLARLDGYGVTGLLAILTLVALFHIGFTRAAGDGREYFAQLHSIVIDRDLDFSNEARDFGARIPEVYPIGSALLWLPFYLDVHLWLWVLSWFGSTVPLDGYGAPYQMAIGLGTLFYGVIGLLLAHRVARDYFAPGVALAATATVCAGSFLLWYLTLDNAYAHGNSLFAVTLFLYLWHRTRTRARTTGEWMALGAAAALMTMVRWQNAVFLLAPAVDLVVALTRALRQSDVAAVRREGIGVLAAAMVGAVGFLPQLYFWKVTGGGWFAVPHGQAGQMWWTDPLWLDVLFSPNHGLFAWHPLLYVASLGMVLFVRRNWTLAAVLAGLFVLQTYLNGAVSTWWGGSAFGGRRFDGCALFFILGMASVIEAGLRRPAVVMGGVAAVFVAANALLMTEVSRGALPIGEGITADQFGRAAYRRIGNPFSFPANALFARSHGGTAADYDQLGRQLFSNIHIDLGGPEDDRFLIYGWSGPEGDETGTFRWSEGESSGISVPLLGARVVPEGEAPRMPDYVLRLTADPFGVPGRDNQEILVEVNGSPISRQVLTPGMREYVVRIPGDRLGRGLNRLTFRYGYAVSPEEAGLGTDTRALGVRFGEIHLEQVTGG